MSHNYSLPAFTLIEITLSLTVIAWLTVMALPVYRSFQIRNDLNISTETIVSTLRRAALFSRSGVQDQSWGVDVRSAAITLFAGNDFTNRNKTYDEVFVLPPTIIPSGWQTVTFTKVTGDASLNGPLTLTTINSDTSYIYLSNHGVITY